MESHTQQDAVLDISWPLQVGATSWRNNDKEKLTFTHTRQWVPDKARSTIMSMSIHTGTHCDAPSHFLEHGHHAEGIHWRQLCGPCVVIDLTADSITQAQQIKKEDLLPFHSLFQLGTIVLFKTANSLYPHTGPFNMKFIALADCAASYLASLRVKCVGTDYLGIERSDFQPGHETHSALLSSGVAVMEGLRLAHVSAMKPSDVKLFEAWRAGEGRKVWPSGEKEREEKEKKEEKEKEKEQREESHSVPVGLYRMVCLPLSMVGVEASPCRALLMPLTADLRDIFA